MAKEVILDALRKNRLLVIVRGVGEEKLEPLFEALYRGGVRLAEITFDQSGKIPSETTAREISDLRRRFEGRIHVGAGTVTNPVTAKIAVRAGAEFLVSPNVNSDVIRVARENDILSMPGAMTPTEICDAWDAGADVIKVFPADTVGAAYLKAIRAPLCHIPMLAVGGVTVTNIHEFLATGVLGVAISSDIIRSAWLDANDFDRIEEQARFYCEEIAK